VIHAKKDFAKNALKIRARFAQKKYAKIVPPGVLDVQK
jgi:hypothetical protein